MRVRSISKRYGLLAALDDVSFEIRSGEILGLIGPNGAGKTTLLECVAGTRASDAGVVEVDGHALSAAERTSRLFYLSDGIAPWPAQTVRWALDFVVGFLEGRAADVGAVVVDLGLASFLDQPIGTLSKGQRKRALLAVGLLAPQPILICDEPFDGLDLRQTRETAATLRRAAAAGRTLVLSIHQIQDAARVCDRFVLLSGGRVRGEGTLDELVARAGDRAAAPDLSEVFLALT